MTVNDYLVETFTKVDLAEDLTTSDVMNEVPEVRERVNIKLCLLVYQTVVPDWAK